MKVYVDMDGVLVNFRKGLAPLLGSDDPESDIAVVEAMGQIKHTRLFWYNLEPFDNALTLLATIKLKFGGYTILTAPLESDPSCATQKLDWCHKHLYSCRPDEIIVQSRKYLYATDWDDNPNLLIDDFGYNIKQWEEHGGIAIKHKDYKFDRTISELIKINADI